MNGLLVGLALGGLLYAASRRSSSSPATPAHAPAPDLPATSPAPATGVPVVVMAGFNVRWPESIVATQSYMERNVPPAVDDVVRRLNTLGRGTFSSPRTMIRSTSYGYLATVLVLWSTSSRPDTTWLAGAVRDIIRARGGDVSSHLREVTAST